MSDKTDILDELRELVDLANNLSDRVDAIRDKIDDDEIMVKAEVITMIANELEGDEADQPYDVETEATENAAWSEGWQACIDRIRQEYWS